MVWVMPSASRRSRKHLASRSVNRIERSAAPSSSAPPFDVIAPPSKAPSLAAVLDKPGGRLAGKSTLNRLEHAGRSWPILSDIYQK